MVGEYTKIMNKTFTKEDAQRLGDVLGVDWSQVDVDQLTMGLNVELEHGTKFPDTNVTDDDELVTAKIALAHLKELPDYYSRLAQMENE